MHHNRYQLKRLGQRATIIGATFALAVAAFLPAASVFADGLNPLTERSLLLSSSAPGYINTDGSGNSNDNTTGLNQTLIDNGGPYAQPGTGPNGMKSGETFSFRVSTDSTAAGTNKPVMGMTLQYCTSAAGLCQAPGNNDGDARVGESAAGKNDGVYDSTTNAGGRWTNAQESAAGAQKSDLNANYTNPVEGTDFIVYADPTNSGTLTQQTGWSMAVSNAEDQSHTGAMTGKNNLITLTDTNASGLGLQKNALVKVVFNASPTNYITNPGQGSFFVKMNTYDTANTSLMIPTVPAYNATTGEVNNPDIIDGGVTVANVMTDSILITTKVLETMAFSVGTENRDTQALTTGSVHGTCDAMIENNANRLNMGDVNSENSLAVDKAYDAYSYWRLSSNSSGGATVYYSGNTLANTVGDKIAEIGGTKAVSTPGTEQFGLAFVDPASDNFPDFGTAPATTNLASKPSMTPFDISTEAVSQPYNSGTGTIYDTDGTGHTIPGTAQFAFLSSSQTVPVPIAQENSQVISCATAKMRYVANIAADTPAGIYTTKINYLAAPQY